jgi:type IV pilus assembly protein PilA
MYQLLRKRVAGKKGFTLIELIVVIAVIAILAVILIPRFTGFTKSAREKSVLSDARNIQMALEAMDAEGEFPTGDTGDKVNAYLGKDVVTKTNAGATVSDNGDSILTGVAKSTGGIDFKYEKNLGGNRYTVQCTDSVLGEVSPT